MAREDIAGRVESILNEYLEDKELELYRVQFKKEGPDWKLKVFLDKPEGADTEYVSIDECTEATKYLNEILDKEDFIEKAYTLEISSPGLDRELIKDSDYRRFSGRLVEIKLYQAIDGVKSLEAELIGKEDGMVNVSVDGEVKSIPADKISKINLAVVF